MLPDPVRSAHGTAFARTRAPTFHKEQERRELVEWARDAGVWLSFDGQDRVNIVGQRHQYEPVSRPFLGYFNVHEQIAEILNELRESPVPKQFKCPTTDRPFRNLDLD